MSEHPLLPRRRFLSLLGFSALAAACGTNVLESSSTTGSSRNQDSATTSIPGSASTSPPSTTRAAAVEPVTETTRALAPKTAPPPSTAPPTTVPPTTTTTTTASVTTSAAPGPALLGIESRSAWLAREPVAELLLPHSGDMKYLTVHHAGGDGGAQGIKRYQIWQNYHMDDKGWGDIAYHLIIHRDGTVYEARDGRYRGDTGTNYNPDRHFLVVVEGGFNANSPTDDQFERLAVVLAWAAQEFGLSVGSIGGHRDYANTSCPGNNLYRVIADGSLRSQVDDIIAGGGVRLI